MADTARAIDMLGIECNVGPDGDGVLWSVAFIDDAPDSAMGRVAPTGRHGLGLGPLFRHGRTLAPEGSVEAPTQALAEAAAERLRALGLNGEGDIVWYEDVPKFLTVTQVDAAKLTDPIDGWFEFDLRMLAPFPFRRAVTEKTELLTDAGPYSLVNDGTMPAYPVITVVMDGTVDLVIAGRHFTTDTLPAGAVIDMWARTIVDSAGDPITPWPKHSETEWLALPTGSTSVDQFGIATLDFTHHDTYA